MLVQVATTLLIPKPRKDSFRTVLRSVIIKERAVIICANAIRNMLRPHSLCIDKSCYNKEYDWLRI